MANTKIGLQSKKARRRFVEQQLRDYRINKNLLAHYRLPGGAVGPALSCLRPGLPENGAESQGEVVELADQMERMAWYVEAIDDLLAQVSEEERQLLEARYFSPRPQTAWQVANLLFISRTEFYRRRDRLLSWLEKRCGLVVEDTTYLETARPPRLPH